MREERQLKQQLISKDSKNNQQNITVDVQWLKNLFQPDNIKDGISFKNIEKINGYSGLENRLKTNLNTGVNGFASDLQWRAFQFGKNDPIVKPPRTIISMILSTFDDETMKILCIAAIVSLGLGVAMHGIKEGWIQGASIILAVVIISAVTACNDYAKQKQFRKLNEQANRKNVNVIRNGQNINMNVYDVLVGDIVQVQTGQILSVDGIVFKSSKLYMDQSSINGQSDPIQKQDFQSKKQCNSFLISGSKVNDGTGYMIVLAVGKNSREGMSRLKLQDDADQTPLQEKLEQLANQIGRLGLAAAGLTFLALFLHLIVDTITYDRCFLCFQSLNGIIKYFIIAVSIVVIAVPQGLPLAVTISLAYSVGKMKDQNNLVRYLAACETMGGANNICTDKTGTLTKNLMTVARCWIEEKPLDSFDRNSKFSKNTMEMLSKGICLNSTANPKIGANQKWEQIGNKTQCALLQFAYKLGYNFVPIRKQIKIIDSIPFSSKRKKMSIICKMDDGKNIIFSKGAPDFLFDSCKYYLDKNGDIKPIDDDFNSVFLANLKQYAVHSLRTLLLCYRNISNEQLKSSSKKIQTLEKDLIVIGLVGIKDPLKDGIPSAVDKCKRAGITVRMVTGDNIQTAIAIAKQANILLSNYSTPSKGSPGQFSVMQGKQFRERVQGTIINEKTKKQQIKNIQQFSRIIKQLRVLARSSPQDKHTLATGLKQMGYVVAMTGDGTNDAPALKKADIGFAMGIAGTEIARQAAGIILLDDNFGSIITAIKFGRNIFDCIRKFLQFQLTVNIVAIFMAFLGAVIIKQSPLTPVQMLWVNLIMDTLAALALATQPPSEQLLYRMPYSRKQKIITAQMWRFIVMGALFQILVLIIILFRGPQIFGVMSSIGLDSQHWNEQTGVHLSIFFDVFVFLQVFNFFNARKLSKDQINIFTNINDNYLFMVIVVGIFVCQLFIVQFGGKALMLVPLSASQHCACMCIGALSLVNGYVVKKLVPDTCFNYISIFNETEKIQIYDVDSQLKKIWLKPVTRKRSTRHRA